MPYWAKIDENYGDWTIGLGFSRGLHPMISDQLA
jgi:hypothetical protein